MARKRTCRKRGRKVLIILWLITVGQLRAEPIHHEGAPCYFEGHICDVFSSRIDVGYLLATMLNSVIGIFMLIISALLIVYIQTIVVIFVCSFCVHCAIRADHRHSTTLATPTNFNRYCFIHVMFEMFRHVNVSLCRLSEHKKCFFIHSPSGRITTLQLRMPFLLSKLKSIIASKTGIPPNKQHLYSEGRLLHSNLCLLNLKEGANINLLFKIVGGGQNCDICKTTLGTMKCAECEGKLHCTQCSAQRHGISSCVNKSTEQVSVITIRK